MLDWIDIYEMSIPDEETQMNLRNHNFRRPFVDHLMVLNTLLPSTLF